jgi:predicted MPP superfamily phosphohydrolase
LRYAAPWLKGAHALNSKGELDFRTWGKRSLTEPTLVAAPSRTASLRDTMFTRRNFLGLAAGSAAALAFYAGEIARHELEIVELTVRLPRLPDAFAGMKIVQVSDIHFEVYTEAAFLDAIVRKVNAVAPDLVVLTGDFVSSKPLPQHFSVGLGYQCAEHLSRLTCPLRYAILGNHDCMVGSPAITDALHTHGIPVLANSSVPLERNGQRVWLAGVKDVLEDKPDLGAAISAGRSKHEPVILLAHEPDFADYAVARQVDLVLSGHTHGGQILLPLLPPLLLPDMGIKYVHGLFRMRDGMQLYVNRGIGAVTLPFRFRCQPEMTVITLAQG